MEIQELINKVAEREKRSQDYIKRGIEKGEIVIPYNKKRPRDVEPIGIGNGLRIKINANIGSSPDIADIENEIKKLEIAVKAGADAVMDLSIGGDVDSIRREIISHSDVIVGTVPVYQAALDAAKKQKSFVELSVDEIFDGIKKHIEDGVDFITVHTGVSKESLERLRSNPRVSGVVSRGGSMMLEWIAYNNKENPLKEYFETLLDMAKEYNVTLSLGDGLRPGALVDATDGAQIQELILLGEQVLRAREKGVMVMVEGPGHIPIHEIETNIRIQKSLCHNAPFYVLGPLPTDLAPGYDHIVSAIGGAMAGYFGADFLCYVTPAEHLGLPTLEDVREGVIASKIAAHIADIGREGRIPEKEKKMANFRFNLEWEKQFSIALAPEKARKKFEKYPQRADGVCTMCGEFCALRRTRRALEK